MKAVQPGQLDMSGKAAGPTVCIAAVVGDSDGTTSFGNHLTEDEAHFKRLEDV
jgi:hypothetical protein